MYAMMNQNNVKTAQPSEWNIDPQLSRMLNYFYVGVFLLLALLQYLQVF